MFVILLVGALCAACFGRFEERDGGGGDGDGDGDVDEPVSDADFDEAGDAELDSEGDSEQELCTAGYRWDGDGCVDIDECDEESHDCAPEATCTNVDGDHECACVDGYEGDGTWCVDIDECATDADDCGENASCTNSAGGFDCACDEGYEGDGTSCIDIDECAAATTPCDEDALCANTEGGYQCRCLAASVDEHGDGSSCLRQARVGHVVLIGHDYFRRTADIDLIVGSAVLLAPTDERINVLVYTEHADTGAGGEVANTDAAIAERLAGVGRTMSLSELTLASQLADELPGQHVLLIYEQERASDDETLQAIGESWADILGTFVRAGGVVILCDHGGGDNGTWQILDSAGLLSISSSDYVSSGSTVRLASENDPLAWGLDGEYTASSGTRSYSTWEGIQVSRNETGRPVVIHKLVRRGADFYGLPYDFFEWDTAAANLLLRATTFGYEMTPVIAAVRECTDQETTTGESPDGTFAGEYNSTLGALNHAGIPTADIRRLTDRGAAQRLIGTFDVLLFPEQERCVVSGEDWAGVVWNHVARGGRVVVTTAGAGGALFVNDLGMFGRGEAATAREPFTTEDSPFWEGISHPGANNATQGWDWRGLRLRRLGTAADGETLTVFGYDL